MQHTVETGERRHLQGREIVHFLLFLGILLAVTATTLWDYIFGKGESAIQNTGIDTGLALQARPELAGKQVQQQKSLAA